MFFRENREIQNSSIKIGVIFSFTEVCHLSTNFCVCSY